MGKRIGPENFERNTPATSTALPASVQGVRRCSTTHIAPAAAVKNNAAAMSEVTSAPCASSVGLNAKSSRLSHAPVGEISRLAHKNTSAPSTTPMSAIIPRPRHSIAPASLPLM